MGILDPILNLIGGATDLAQGSIGDVVGGLAEVPGLQEIQDQATTVTDGAAEAATNIGEQGQTAVDGITQNLGL